MMLEDDEHKNELIDRWTMRKRVCVLGAGEKPLSEIPDLPDDFEAIRVDVRKLPTTDIIQDLNKGHWEKLKSNLFDIVIAEHIAEHVDNRLAFLNQCRRILVNGGMLIIEVPNWKHITAHSNLEHKSTWSRVIFDDCYVNGFGKKWKIEKIAYRVTNPFTWKSFYIKNEFVGRQLDRFTSLVSGLRFYLRVE